MLKTFPKGGVHPPENKITATGKIELLPLPATVSIPVTQHIGAPATPVVAKGDRVLTGQEIARPNGLVSAGIHSSVSGIVTKVEPVPDISGYKQLSVVIDVKGDDWVETIDRDPVLKTDITLSAGEIIERCRQCGIVGLGGATFPTHVKLKIPAGKRCSLLIINGVECEPYLTSDHRLMLEMGGQVLTGVRIMMKALGLTRAMIGVENNKPDAIDLLRTLCNGSHEITVHPLKVKYPQGGEKQLIKALTGREVPPGGLPVDVETIVHNVGTAYAVYEAVQKNKPLFERVVTVTGASLKSPGNFLVRIGTPVARVIEAAGGMPGDAGKIISGGPMMGKALFTADVPVIKGTSGIIVMPSEVAERQLSGPCIRCGKCISACAMNLEPYLLMVLSERGMFEKAGEERITDCMECGSCSYICPARRPLLDYIRLGKSTAIRMAREKKMK